VVILFKKSINQPWVSRHQTVHQKQKFRPVYFCHYLAIFCRGRKISVSFQSNKLTPPEIIFIAVICRSATSELTWDDSEICDHVEISLSTDTCDSTAVLSPYPLPFTKAEKIKPP